MKEIKKGIIVNYLCRCESSYTKYSRDAWISFNETGRQIDRQIGRLLDRQMDRLIDKWIDKNQPYT